VRSDLTVLQILLHIGDGINQDQKCPKPATTTTITAATTTTAITTLANWRRETITAANLVTRCFESLKAYPNI